MEIIRQLTEAHEALLALALSKKEALIQNDMSRLSKIVKEEPVLLKRIATLEQERIEYMGTVTMTEWIASHPEDVETLRALLATMGQLRKANALNAELLEQSLHYIEWHLQLLVPEADDFTYGQSSFDRTHFNRNA